MKEFIYPIILALAIIALYLTVGNMSNKYWCEHTPINELQQANQYQNCLRLLK